MTRARWFAAGALLAGVLVVAVLVSFGPYVRHLAQARAARRGAALTIGSVRPAANGIVLRDVEVSFADAPSLSVRLDEIRVAGGVFGTVTGIRVSGGLVRARGALEELRRQIAAVLGKARAEEHGAGPTTLIELEGLDVAWEAASAAVHVRGATLRRSPSGWTAGAETADVSHGDTKGRMRGGTVDVRREGAQWRIASLELRGLDAEHVFSARDTVGAPGPAVSAASSGGPSNVAPVPRDGTETPPDGLVARTELVRRLVGRTVAAALAVLAPGASVGVGEMRLELRHREDVLHLGPSALRIDARDGAVDVSLSPVGQLEGGTPLRVSASLPVEIAAPIAATVEGGPVSVAALGIREGDLGLLDVGKTTVEGAGKVELLADARHLEGNLHGKVRGLSLQHKKLASEAVRGLDLGFAVIGGVALDGSWARVDRGDIDVATVHAEIKGELARSPEGTTVKGTFAIPLASCQGLVDALPAGLAPVLVGVKVGGTFALRGQIAFDSRRVADALVDLTLMNECRVTTAPAAINVARFRAPFRRKVYTPDGQRVEIDSGPGTPGWVPYAGISRFMEAAVLTTEDGGFRRHRGFDVEAIRNSIRENLKAGRFVRGASTISMQTAKNVYLEREKTLSRKLQEAFLTSYLEQELSKEQILELYLNSIEFGPMIYGIGPAAAHYFHTSAADLSLGQALYLSSILPNPKMQHFGEGGRVSASWMGYLHKLMRIMLKHDLIDDADLAEGLGEWVVFGQPKPMRARGDDSGTLVEGAPPDDVMP